MLYSEMMSKLTRLISIIYKVFVLKYELFRKLQNIREAHP